MLLAATLCSSASSSVRNSRVETGSFAAFRCRKKSTSIAELALPRQQKREVSLHRRPLAFDDAEDHRVAIAAIDGDLVIAQHAVLLRADPRQRRARGLIEP